MEYKKAPTEGGAFLSHQRLQFFEPAIDSQQTLVGG